MPTLSFSSQLQASPQTAWQWITSVKGITREIMPLMRMSFPRGVSSLTDLMIEPGRPLFRSILYLGGLLPMDGSLLTLLELRPGEGFVEQSPMLSMKLWRHERSITPTNEGCTVTDVLTFEPRFATPLVGWFVRQLFTHRHQVLRRYLQGISNIP